MQEGRSPGTGLGTHAIKHFIGSESSLLLMLGPKHVSMNVYFFYTLN